MDECIHGMIGCSTCTGLDEPRPTHKESRDINFWSDEERAIASDSTLTTAEVARLLHRTTSQVSAYRIVFLKMTDYAGHISKGH